MRGFWNRTRRYRQVLDTVSENQVIQCVAKGASTLIKGDVGRGAKIVCIGNGATVTIRGNVHESALIIATGTDAVGVSVHGSVARGVRIATHGDVSIKGTLGDAGILCKGEVHFKRFGGEDVRISASNRKAYATSCMACRGELMMSSVMPSPSEMFGFGGRTPDASTAKVLRIADETRARDINKYRDSPHTCAYIDWDEVQRLAP